MKKKVLEVKNISKIYKIYKSNFDRLKEIFVKKYYHKVFVANNDISFTLYEKETLGIIGVNGAGKSTILKIIAKVIAPTSGEILTAGRVTALLELGTGFNQQISGYDNIFLNGELIGMTQQECREKSELIINFSELGDYIYEPIMTYSSGMVMRLAFSIAIYSDPDILIVDEALSVGDAYFAEKCTKALKERKEKNMSIIYVSHDLNSLKLLCDRVLLLNKGTIVESGKPEEVINSYNFLISKLNDSEEKIVFKNNDTNSYGTLDAEINSISIKGENSRSSVISSGENAMVKFDIKSNIDIKEVNIGFLDKDKFGQDIFGTSTKNLHKVFNFKKDTKYLLTIMVPMNIGAGQYSLSTALAIGDTHLDHCLHWFDYSASFEIAGNYGENYIGICKLAPKIKSMEIVNE